IKGLHQLAVESLEDVVVAAFLQKLGNESLARVIVDGFAPEDRMMHARQRAWSVKPRLFRLRFLLPVCLRVTGGHSLEIDSVIAVGWILEIDALELLDQESHPLEAIATMAVSAVGQETDHCLVDLHARGGLRPIGRNCALGALRRT